MQQVAWTAVACGAALLPLAWLASQARKNGVKPNNSISGHKVVITGGSKGLGLALANEFLNLGDQVVIAARDQAACAKAAQLLQLEHPGRQVYQTTCDVTKPDHIQQLAVFAREKLGQIDIWVNNAAVSQIPKAPLADTAAEQITQIVGTNLLGPLLGSQAAIQVMRTQATGGRVFLIDGAGSRGNATANTASYGSTKAAMPQLLRSLASELRNTNVSVHLASPGMVATDLLLKGVSNKASAARIVNILAEEPKIVAAWLVPRMRGVTGNGKYFKYLTPFGVLIRCLTFKSRRNRFLLEGAKQP